LQVGRHRIGAKQGFEQNAAARNREESCQRPRYNMAPCGRADHEPAERSRHSLLRLGQGRDERKSTGPAWVVQGERESDGAAEGMTNDERLLDSERLDEMGDNSSLRVNGGRCVRWPRRIPASWAVEHDDPEIAFKLAGQEVKFRI
jgi:hypothetical protein